MVRVVGPYPNGRTPWLINWGPILTTLLNWDDPPSATNPDQQPAPSNGYPSCAKWARIWCLRPVWSFTFLQVVKDRSGSGEGEHVTKHLENIGKLVPFFEATGGVLRVKLMEINSEGCFPGMMVFRFLRKKIAENVILWELPDGYIHSNRRDKTRARSFLVEVYKKGDPEHSKR